MTIPSPDEGVVGADTLAIIPDSQIVVRDFPELYRSSIDWLVQNAGREGIAAVLHVGDVVNDGAQGPRQYEFAAEQHGRLVEAGLPLFVAPGNHDYDNMVDTPGRPLELFGLHLATARHADRDWFGGSWDVEPANCWGRVNLAGRDWLVVVLEFGPRLAAVEWAKQVIEAQGLPTILLTHTYLTSQGQLIGPDARFTPTDSPGAADGLDGFGLWRALRTMDQVRIVLCGHHVPENVAWRVDLNDAGLGVFAGFQNWQMREQGGQGRLRLVRPTPQGAVQLSVVNPATGERESGPALDGMVDTTRASWCRGPMPAHVPPF